MTIPDRHVESRAPTYGMLAQHIQGHSRGIKPMADEVFHANVIAITARDDGCWTASIGPANQGMQCTRATAEDALDALAYCIRHWGWIFDPTWNPR